MARFRKSSYTQREFHQGKHRFEHWYRDNTFYFITSKTREGAHLFLCREAKDIFWNRFGHYTAHYGLRPIITTVLSNHYHTLLYVAQGENIGPFMQRLHGSVAKLVNDTLPQRHLPFWRTKGNKDYFDGCLRDETQLTRTYRYIQNQAVRARLVATSREYRDTHVAMSLEEALALAHKVNPFLPTVPYARYQNSGR